METAKFIGKVCPYCKSEFTAEDNIVVCSSCDMPHHKDCWIENQGCTTFGCQGTIKNADSAASAVTATQMQYDDRRSPAGTTIYCSRCGTPLPADSTFCTRCGNRLGRSAPVQSAPVYRQAQSAPIPPASPYTGYQNFGYNGALDPDVVEMIGSNAPYYTQKFQELKLQRKMSSWNWPAFFFGPYWMLYRKMYLYGGIGAGVAFVLPLLGTLGSLISFGAYIALGILGNYLYMNHLEGLSAQAKTMVHPQRAMFLAQNKDVNTAAAVLTALGCGLLSVMLNL